MFDRFNQILNFAADPPDGGGGTKTADSSLAARTTADPPDGGGGTKAAALGGQIEVDSTTQDSAAIDPPENTAIDPPENTGTRS